jgi:gamma-glutamyltranspeptidase/glutathione hydrolase
MSDSYADRSAALIRGAVNAKRPLDLSTKPVEAGGTTHLSVADKEGNLVAVTLTHGDGFGSRVVVPGHGLILGHGLSRFEPTAGHANGLAARKQPLDNMCPTIVFRNGRPVTAIGATGGRRIPNALFDVLVRMIYDGASLPDAVAAPRLNTQGGLDVSVTSSYPQQGREHFTNLGFRVKVESPAIVQAVTIEPAPVAAGG